MRILLIISLSTFITTVHALDSKPAAENINGEGSTYQGIDMTNVTDSIRRNGQEIKKRNQDGDGFTTGSPKNGFKEEKAEEAEQVLETTKINVKYKEALKTNKCEKQFWSRYEYASYFQSLASKYKITPYDVVLGDAYIKRNISKIVLYEASSNYINYVSAHIPDAIITKFNQDFSDEQEKKRNEKTVFNISIKRDYECYKKLK